MAHKVWKKTLSTSVFAKLNAFHDMLPFWSLLFSGQKLDVEEYILQLYKRGKMNKVQVKLTIL